MVWFARKRNRTDGLVGLEVRPTGIALAHVVRLPGEAPRLRACLFRDAERAQQPAVLRRMVADLDLVGARVNVLLHPADYQMLLLESPEVPAEELRDAIRWRIKDLINDPLEQVVVDAFTLPEDAYRGRLHMAYCAVLNKARMHIWGALVRQAGLEPVAIDVTEMAFRNLGLLAGAEGINLATLRLRSSEGLICVQQGGDLYMARRIEHGLEEAGSDYSQVTLEIQRSLDYFESQLGKGYLNRLLLLPNKRNGTEILRELSAGLAVNLLPLDLRELFPGQGTAELDEPEQARCIAAVGAALRQETG